MLKLSNIAIERFKRIYKDEYGVDLDDERANILALELLELFRLIYRPMRKDELSSSKESYSLRSAEKTR